MNFQGSPKWNNNYCQADPEETKAKADEARQVAIPNYDPIVSISNQLSGNEADAGF